MRKQTFRGKSMAEVVEVVKREMGNDAVIVSVRQVPLGPVWKVWQSPGVEVIAIAKGSNKDTRTNDRKSNRDSPPKPPVQTEKKSEEKPVQQIRNVAQAKSPPAQPAGSLVSEEDTIVTEPQKKIASGSKAVSLRAFQAAMRRSASPQKSGDVPDTTSGITEDEVLSPSATTDPLSPPDLPLPPEVDAAIKSTPPDYGSLSLDTPKPKLALDELAQALTPRAEGKSRFADFLREKGFMAPPPPVPKDAGISSPAKENSDRTAMSKGKIPQDLADISPPEQVQKIRPTSVEKSTPAAKPRPRIHLSHPLSGEALTSSSLVLPKAVESMKKHLLDQGVENDIVEKLTRSCAESLSPQTLAKIGLVQDYIGKQMEGHIRILSKAQADTHHLICVVGPSGAGKTNLIAKLAAQAVKEQGLETIWISADTVRTGAIAEARIYADLIGIPLLLVYTPDELKKAIKDCAACPHILVDTPASNPWREASMVELGELLNVIPARATYLTVPATSKDADLRQIQAGYGVFKINGLVITKMDETRSLGSAYNFAWHSQLPLAYFSSGTRLLEDLHYAEAKAFIQEILGQHIGAG